MGVLSCVSGDTLIYKDNGEIPVKELVGKYPSVYCTDGKGNIVFKQATKVWSNGVKKTVKITFDSEDYLVCTPDHKIMLSDGSYKEAQDLKHEDLLCTLSTMNHVDVKYYEYNPIKKAVSVIEDSEVEVFDISVPDYHNFVANGVFVHNCTHPDIEEFITAKQTEGRLSKFNVSVGVTDALINAVMNDEDWHLEFPDTRHAEYSAQWKGDLDDWKAKGFPVKIHKTLKARDLWEKIAQMTYNRNEPGVLFIDTINNMNPLVYAEKIHTTNPCFHGEERFLTEAGYIKFKDSYSKNTKSVFTDSRISYQNDGEEKPENWKIDLSKKGVTLRNSSSAFITSEYSDLLEIDFSNGQTVKCTPDHHFATKEGMVQAKDLTPEHEILVSIPEPKYENSIVSCLPETENEIYAFIMGLISGTGYIEKDRCHIKILNDSCVSFIKSSLEKLPGIDRHSFIVSNGELIISCQSLCTILDKYYTFNDKTNIPEYIINKARTKQALYYLSGLYSVHGVVSADNKNIHIRLSNINKESLQKVQLLLHANGISSKIYSRRGNNKYISNTYGEYIAKDKFELITTCDSWKVFAKLIDFKNTEKDIKLKELLKEYTEDYSNTQFASIVSVKEIEGDTVYCLKEDVSRSLIVNTLSARRCGEIPMGLGVCLLFSFNLVKFIKQENGNYIFDFDMFKKAVAIGTRFADNINDISRTPLPEYQEAVHQKRRIGLGVLGLGSLHYILGIPFASPESLELIDSIFKAKAETEILASAKLGVEKGSFPLFNKEILIVRQMLQLEIWEFMLEMCLEE
jgi:ribonucleoside-diphosphate reductase alpha chain